MGLDRPVIVHSVEGPVVLPNRGLQCTDRSIRELLDAHPIAGLMVGRYRNRLHECSSGENSRSTKGKTRFGVVSPISDL
jgi:hypothetical protein